jgi:hypothetical protein
MSTMFTTQSQFSEVREAGRRRTLAVVSTGIAIVAVTVAAIAMITLGA